MICCCYCYYNYYTK